MLCTEIRKSREIVDCACIHRTCIADHAKRLQALRFMTPNRVAQSSNLDLEVCTNLDGTKRLFAKSQQLKSLDDGIMGLVRTIKHHSSRGSEQSVLLHIDAGLHVARYCQADDIRHRSTGHQ